MNTKQDYIAVFDSGVGGISVLRHLVKQMPGEKYLYFGDSANAPYGSRTTEEVRELTLAAAEKLITENPIKALVIACNTATAAAVKDLRKKYPNLIVIGIEPALKLAADHFPGGRVGVMATEVTLREEKFDVLLHRFDENCAVFKIPAPGLVQLIEAGKADSPETEILLRSLLSPYIGKLDALVLGCTHYPFAAKAISRVLGNDVTLLDGGDGTARETRRRLLDAGLLENGEGSITIRNSSGDERMIALCEKLLKYTAFGGNMNYESLIFDIDGTLWDSRALVAEGYNIQLRKEGLAHLCITADDLLPLFGKVMPAIFDVILATIPVEERYQLMDRCIACEDEYLKGHPCQIAYPGVQETIAKLAEKHRLFIVSNSQSGYPALCAEKLGLTPYITGHLCFGDTNKTKGENIRILMERHGIENAAYIGDTQGDYEAAQAAGVDFIWCSYGFETPKGYAAKVDSFPELLKL